MSSTDYHFNIINHSELLEKERGSGVVILTSTTKITEKKHNKSSKQKNDISKHRALSNDPVPDVRNTAIFV